MVVHLSYYFWVLHLCNGHLRKQRRSVSEPVRRGDVHARSRARVDENGRVLARALHVNVRMSGR